MERTNNLNSVFTFNERSMLLNITQPDYSKIKFPKEILNKRFLYSDYLDTFEEIVNVNFSHSLLDLVLFRLEDSYDYKDSSSDYDSDNSESEGNSKKFKLINVSGEYETGLLINCFDNYIYTMVYDDHSRVSIDRTVSYEMFKKDEKEYYETKDFSHFLKNLNYSECDIYSDNGKDEDIENRKNIIIKLTFSTYIRLKYGLDFYYG